MPSQVTKTSRVAVDGLELFYRSAGPQDAPAILLLHGFPTSSHMFRHLIPLLAKKYRVYAPDLPGYGFTTIPEERRYSYTFDNLAETTDQLIKHLGLKQYAIYIMDYGAPVGLRIAVKHPDAITAIITQNGNAYDEGFGADFWGPLRAWWKTDSVEEREELAGKLLTFETTKWQYEFGNPKPESVGPEAYYLDQVLLDRPGNSIVQMDLFKDYQHNSALYPAFQQYFRESGVPVLAIWGQNDIIFVKEGAAAFERDVKKENLEIHLIDAGHFALETNEEFFAEKIDAFLSSKTSRK